MFVGKSCRSGSDAIADITRKAAYAQKLALMPRIASHVECLGDLIALAAHDLRFKVLASFSFPFPICQSDPFLALRAPRIWKRIFWIFLGPEEALAFTLQEACSYVLTNKGFGLQPMGIAMDWVRIVYLGFWCRWGSARPKECDKLAEFHATDGNELSAVF